MSSRRYRPEGGRALQVASLVAAFVLAAIVNVLGARHFTRWDWTRDKRWSLSPATLQTLRSLEQRVDVWAIAGAGDPLAEGLRSLLASYRAQSSRIDVHWIDPDRDTVQLVDLQHRFGLEAGRADDGRIATDAVLVVASGDKHWFLTPQDLFQSSDEVHVKPREERALTLAIRSVLGGEKTRVCFTVGHGELSLDPGRDERQALGQVRDLLEKNNYNLVDVDTTSPDAQEPFAPCSIVMVAGASAPFAQGEAAQLRSWLLAGGRLLAALGPVEASTSTGFAPAGLDEVLAPFGIALDDDLVHDSDPGLAIADTHGEGFFVTARPHPVTASLVAGGSDAHPPRVALFYTRSLRHVSPPGASASSDLLVTSAQAFSKASIAGASAWGDSPPRSTTDASGPFVVAMASERPRTTSNALHGPRVVVVGSRFVLSEENWRQPRPLHGAAFFIDSALSWLAARPEVIDVPERAEIAAGIRVTEAARFEVRRYVLGFMPLAALLLGVAVWAWRKSSEDRPYVAPHGKKGPSPP